MKIGTFARKFGLNQSAVRYYIANGLLTPDRKGGQLEFDKECIADMEKILKFKKYHFSLDEIQLLFFMERASCFQDETILQVCADILVSKREQLISERDSLERFIAELAEEIENLPAAPQAAPEAAGVPYSFIPYLYCPRCQKPLGLDSASLIGGGIRKGILRCECGYQADISDGVIICSDHEEDTPFKAFDNVDSVISMKNQFSALYRLLITKTYVWMYNNIAKLLDESRFILAGPFTLNFMLEYHEKLGRDKTFIIFDPSLKRIGKIRRYMSAWEYSVIYIAGKPEDLPIRKETADIYIDDYSTVNSMFTYNTFSTESIAPLIRHNGAVAGIFSAYKESPRSIANFKKDHPNFQPERMTMAGLRSGWARQDVQVVSEKSIGSTTAGELHYPQDELGERVEVLGYLARKGAHRKDRTL